MSLSTAPADPVAGIGAGGRSAPVEAPAEARRHELAAFLRSRRERIAPEQVGLPVTGRRRTPGLRREEVAQLAAVGVTWYTWLEQGRAIQVSVQVLDAVARALLLDRNERAHLFALAGADDPSPVQECATVTPAVRLMLDQFGPMPAAVVNSRYDILAHNHAYTHLAGDLEAQPFEDRNLLWMAFTPSRFQDVLVDVEVEREGMVARFRSAMADHSAEPAWKALVARLRQASPDFEAAWARHEVARPGNGVKRFLVPGAGLLSFDYTGLWLGPRAGSRMVVYTPRCEETRERLALLAAR
ncbi:DNA-binding protein [Kitasatospora herbaricolor]|uniref:helix-turn-helix transcriptional regulator n=1 Tax=Kitasatospora herbaricolor TaxID=68217 RepID=UPI00174E836C|nr:helix-turn-helix transcriptional regulator [Kitasatospora herbaricolor]MDQ0308196.1 transcriptional regulator with XRE-family HTH domain [Kitasatospora herbaricolor]GGV05945.1 DNA-binding protein [Kitasatospora herbaricolor]